MSLASGANNYLPSLVLPLLHAAPPHIRRTSALFDHDLGKISWGDVLPRRQFFSMHARPTGASSCIAPQGSAKLDFDPTRSGARVQNIDETDVISRASQHLPAHTTPLRQRSIRVLKPISARCNPSPTELNMAPYRAYNTIHGALVYLAPTPQSRHRLAAAPRRHAQVEPHAGTVPTEPTATHRGEGTPHHPSNHQVLRPKPKYVRKPACAAASAPATHRDGPLSLIAYIYQYIYDVGLLASLYLAYAHVLVASSTLLT